MVHPRPRPRPSMPESTRQIGPPFMAPRAGFDADSMVPPPGVAPLPSFGPTWTVRSRFQAPLSIPCYDYILLIVLVFLDVPLDGQPAFGPGPREPLRDVVPIHNGRPKGPQSGTYGWGSRIRRVAPGLVHHADAPHVSQGAAAHPQVTAPRPRHAVRP